MITYDKFKQLTLPENIVGYCTTDVTNNWGNNIHLMYMVDNIAVGYGRLYSLSGDKYSIYLEGLNVNPEVRKMGIGLKLQEIRENIGRELGAKQAFLWVSRGSWMYYWYHRRGYRYYKDHDEETGTIWMVKQLS